MNKPIVNKKYLLEKFPGKGGWTYVIIPAITNNKNGPFRWLKVKGLIDNFEINDYSLMPIKGGKLFLPVRAEIRNKIRKEAGDWVKVILYADFSSFEIPKELLVCLEDEPTAYKNFLSYKESDQKAFVNWVYSAKKEETKVARITEMIRKVSGKQKLME